MGGLVGSCVGGSVSGYIFLGGRARDDAWSLRVLLNRGECRLVGSEHRQVWDGDQPGLSSWACVAGRDG